MKSLASVMLSALLALCAGALTAQDADRLTTTGGDVLIGKFIKLEGGKVHFEAAKVGNVQVAPADIKEISLASAREVKWRTGDDVQRQESGTLSSRDGKLVLKDASGEREIDLSRFKGINETVPDERPQWDIGARLFFGWTEGNTETYSMGFRFDIKRTTKHNQNILYGEGNYLQDRLLDEDQVRRRDFAFGYAYRYIFDFNLTIDVTEDLYFNELAGFHWRSVTGVGPGYFIVRQPKTTLHAGAHLTYTYEDQMNGAEDRGYIGARARGEFETFQLDDNLHIKAVSEILFDFDETKNLVVNNSLLVEYKFAGYFTAGMLLRHTWDNIPPEGFRHHDFNFLFTLGFSWGGRWY